MNPENNATEIDYIGSDDLVFYNDASGEIHTGGFSVNSILMKSNLSPIITMNNLNIISGGAGARTKVSDLFNDLAVPNWVLSYNNRIVGQAYKDHIHDVDDNEDDVIGEDLHDKLLQLISYHNNSKPTKKLSRKKKPTINKSKTRKHST
jgi:hypothetical protein